MIEIRKLYFRIYKAANMIDLTASFLTASGRFPDPDETLDILQKSEIKSADAAASLPEYLDSNALSDKIFSAILKNMGNTGDKVEQLLFDPAMQGSEKSRALLSRKRQFCWFARQRENFNAGPVFEPLNGIWNDCCCKDNKPIFYFP